MNIAIIGTGNLGAAIAGGILKDDLATSLILTKRKIEELHTFEMHEKVTCTPDNRAAVAQSDVIITAVQPAQMEGLLKTLAADINHDQLLISVATGYSIAQIEAILGKDQPIMRAMPNTAISVGRSMTTLCGNTASAALKEQAVAIFNSLGKTLNIPEEKMQAATVVCASGIAFWMRLIRATTQGAIQLGFDAGEAREMAIQTCYGAASLLQYSGTHPEAEIDKVTTPMGCTIEGLNEMEFQGMSASLIKGMKASFEKINEIATDK